MTVTRARLLVAAVLFFGWLGWLGYLAAYKTRPVVVSRSQVMAASRFVVGKVKIEPDTGALSKEVTVETDLHPVGTPLTGTIKVMNLEQAEIAGGGTRFEDGKEYLLLLTPLAGGNDAVFELTRPPGRTYRPPPPNDKRLEPGRPYAYRWDNEDVRRQFEALAPK
jgi:hypothetical protein